MHPLRLVHFQKPAQQLVHAANEVLDHGVEIVPDLLGKQQRPVLQVDQLALRGGVALASFFGQRGVLFPRGIGQRLCLGKQARSVGGAQQRVAQSDFIDPDLLQRGDGRYARLVHSSQPDDERLKRRRRVAVPQRLEPLRRHAGHAREILQRLPARGRGHLHIDQRLGKGRTAHLRLDAHRGQRRRKAQDLRFRKPHLMARRRKPHAHGHDGGFRGGTIVAQVHQRRAEVVELALPHACDVGELRQHAGGFVRHDVRGIAQIDHGAGKLREIVRLDAQLPGNAYDLGDVVRRSGDLRGHLLDLAGEGGILFFRRVHGFPDGGKCALVGHRRLDRRRAQREDGRGHDGGQCAARCRQRLGDRFALLAERFQFLTRRCPCGFHGGELLVGLLNFRSRGSHSGFGAVQSGLGIDDRVACLTDLLRIVGLLGGDELILCALQRRFILCQALALQIELLGKHRLLGCKPRNAGIQLLDPHGSQLEAALSQ